MAREIRIQSRRFLVPESGDPCDLWKSYFKELEKAVGKKHAKTLWLLTWKSNGSISCTTGSSFNTWLAREGLEVSSLATRTIADIGQIQGNLFGLGKNLTKAITWIVPGVLTLGIVIVGMLLWNSTKDKSASDLAMLHPAGRLSKLGMLSKRFKK